MTKFRVFGETKVVVSTIVEISDEYNEDMIFEAAARQFKGIEPYSGNVGTYKLIGVFGEHDTISADCDIIFDDYFKE